MFTTHIPTIKGSTHSFSSDASAGIQLIERSKFKFTFLENVEKALILRLDPDWTKEEYLKWRKDWRNTYAGLSRASRTVKNMRSINRIAEKLTPLSNEIRAKEIANFHTEEFLEAKVHANLLLAMRKASKALAHAAYIKHKTSMK
jgi:hypothetical protein